MRAPPPADIDVQDRCPPAHPASTGDVIGPSRNTKVSVSGLLPRTPPQFVRHDFFKQQIPVYDIELPPLLAKHFRRDRKGLFRHPSKCTNRPAPPRRRARHDKEPGPARSARQPRQTPRPRGAMPPVSARLRRIGHRVEVVKWRAYLGLSRVAATATARACLKSVRT